MILITSLLAVAIAASLAVRAHTRGHVEREPSPRAPTPTPAHVRSGTLQMFSGATLAALDDAGRTTAPRRRQTRLYM